MPRSRTTVSTSHAPIGSRQSKLRLLGFGCLFVALSAAGIYAIHSRVADRNVDFDGRLLSWPVLIGVAILLCVYYLADGLRLHYTLKALGHRMRLKQIFRLVFVNIFFSNITPMATGGGFAQMWYMQRWGIPLGSAMAATTIRTVLAVIFIFSATPIALSLLKVQNITNASHRIILPLALFTTVYLAFFTVLIFRTRWLLPPVDALLRGLRRCHFISQARYRRWRFGSRREMLRFSKGVQSYLSGRPRFVLLSVIWTAIFLISLFSFPALLFWGLGYDLNYFSVLGLMVVTTFIMYFAPTPGASGLAEGAFGHFFAGLISGGHLVLVTVAWRALTIYLGMIIGIFVTHHELTRSERDV
jgi:uncharacterized protein (TIRG00374 family)